MRLTVARVRRVVKADLPIEFVPQQLTSYGGLELLRRYFRLLGLHRRIREAFSGYGLGGDYGTGRLITLMIGLFVVGARRLEHLRSPMTRWSPGCVAWRASPPTARWSIGSSSSPRKPSRR